MELVVDRFKQGTDHTLGRLMEYRWITGGTWPLGLSKEPRWERRFLCFTLEDIYRPVKVMHETRIPKGRYEIKLRPEGGKYAKYIARFGEWQKPGMLWITNVPNYEWILIHPVANHKDTSGCLGVGDGYLPEGTMAASSVAYERIYKLISERLLAGERVFITFEDNDR